jgi:hypothetical protein
MSSTRLMEKIVAGLREEKALKSVLYENVGMSWFLRTI